MSVNLSSADIVRRPALDGAYGLRKPEGDVVLSWKASRAGDVHTIEVTEWVRIDEIPDGTVVNVLVQAREVARHDLPLLGRQVEVVMTNDVNDVVTVLVGDDRSKDEWRFGVRLTGAKPMPARYRG